MISPGYCGGTSRIMKERKTDYSISVFEMSFTPEMLQIVISHIIEEEFRQNIIRNK
jgi:hypothetical protein